MYGKTCLFNINIDGIVLKGGFNFLVSKLKLFHQCQQGNFGSSLMSL